jgi:hypothetical protein
MDDKKGQLSIFALIAIFTSLMATTQQDVLADIWSDAKKSVEKKSRRHSWSCKHSWS